MNLSNLKIDVLEVEEQMDGSAIVRMDVNQEFVDWFNQNHNLQEFSQEKFQQWFLEVLGDYVNKLVQQEFGEGEGRPGISGPGTPGV